PVARRRGWASSGGFRSLLRPESDPRVEGGGEQVADQRRDEVDDPDDEYGREEHREVLHLRRGERQQPDPRIAKELLDRDDPPEHVPDLGRDDRDRREQPVAHHMRAEHTTARQTLECRRPRVVGGERLDRPGSGDARDVAEEHERERERRKEERVELREERLVVEEARDTREPTEERGTEDRDEDRAEHEVRDHGERQPRDRDRAVERLATSHGGDNPRKDAERDAQDEGVEREQRGAL